MSEREEFTIDDLIDLNAPIDDFDHKELTEADIKGFVSDGPIKSASPEVEDLDIEDLADAADVSTADIPAADDFDDLEFLDDDFNKEMKAKSQKISPRVESIDNEINATTEGIQEIKYSDDSFLGKKSGKSEKAAKPVRSSRRKAKIEADEDEDFLDDDLEFISQPKPKKKAQPKSGKKTSRRENDARENKKQEQLDKLKKNIVLIIVAIVVIIIAIVAVTKIAGKLKEKKAQENREQAVSVQEYETNGYEDINALISAYYECYKNGETDKIVEYATPMSDTEKAYISMYSQFIEEYNNITCYTKTGNSNGEFIVSVAYDVKFKDVATTAPGLDFFYVRTNSNGKVYIDNIYSPFNLYYQENSLDVEITQLIENYKNSNDLLALQANVQTKYDEAVSKDSSLKTLMEETIPAAVSTWRNEMDAQSLWQEQQVTEEIGTGGESTEETTTPVEYTVQFNETPCDTEKWYTPLDETGVNIRKEPSTDTEIVASALGGSELRLIGTTDNGWYHIKTGDVEGFVKSEFVKETTIKLADDNNNN